MLSQHHPIQIQKWLSQSYAKIVRTVAKPMPSNGNIQEVEISSQARQTIQNARPVKPIRSKPNPKPTKVKVKTKSKKK